MTTTTKDKAPLAISGRYGQVTDLRRTLDRIRNGVSETRGDFDDLHGAVPDPSVPDILGASGIRAAFDQLDRDIAVDIDQMRAANVDRCAEALLRATENLRPFTSSPAPATPPVLRAVPDDPALAAVQDDAFASLERWTHRSGDTVTQTAVLDALPGATA